MLEVNTDMEKLTSCNERDHICEHVLFFIRISTTSCWSLQFPSHFVTQSGFSFKSQEKMLDLLGCVFFIG